ncbi:collagen binding domain-containing protein, partial [Halalkalibacterium halodurans]
MKTLKHISYKLRIFALIALLLSQTLLTSLSLPFQAVANSEKSGLTNVEITDANGQTIDADQFPDRFVSIDSILQIILSWSVDESVAQGAEYSLNIPSALVVSSHGGVLTTTDSQEVGTYEVKDNGEVTLQVNEKGNGTLIVEAAFNKDEVHGKSEVPLTFHLDDETRTITVPFTVEEKTEEAVEPASESETEATIEQHKEDEEEEMVALTTQSTEASGSEITENILTSVQLKDEEGNLIHANENPDLRPALGSAVEVIYNWKLRNNHGYTAGSTFTFQLPDAFRFYNNIENEPLVFTQANTTVGSFNVTTDGTVTMTFNESIEQLSNIRGNLHLWTEFREDLQGDRLQVIHFEAKDEVIASIPVEFENATGHSIDKRGVVDQTFNATEIKWTVDFNKQLQPIEQAILKDPIQTGQALRAGSIKVYELNVQLDGSVVQGAEVDPSSYTIEQVDGNDFQIVFGSIDSAYRVEFITDITNRNATYYMNRATLTGENIDDLSADAGVWTHRGTPLSKASTGYDPATQTITWEIKYNYDGKLIRQADAVLTDLFTNSHILLDDSMKVYRVTINEHGNEVSTEEVSNYSVNGTSDEDHNGFVLQFTEDVQDSYKIIYQTTAAERGFEDATIENTVTTGDHEAKTSRTVHQQTFNKWRGQIDYAKKTVAWEYFFNEERQELTNVIISDVFANGGLTLIEDSFTITSFPSTDEEVTLENGNDYRVVTNETGFTIEFMAPITEPHHVRYETTFDFDARDDKNKAFLENGATLQWQTSSGNTMKKEGKSEFHPDTFTRNNGFKNGLYNATSKEITWNIGVNYNLHTLEHAIVEDFVREGQRLLMDSIEVYEMGLLGWWDGVSQGSKLEEGTDYVIEAVEDGEGHPGFQVRFLNTIDSAYWITFKTSLEDTLIKSNYPNRATLKSDNAEDFNVDASVSVRHGGEFVTKSGAQNGRLIDWSLNINFSQSSISNAKIVDEPSVNQILLEDTFRLYATNVQPNGTMTKGDELERDKDYTLDIRTDGEGNQHFELQFTEDIDTGYILEYQSFINARNGDVVTNNVKLEGDQLTTEEVTESSGAVSVRLSGGAGTGSGETGSLEVTKVDADTGEVLQGATFTLYDSEGEFAIRTLETGEDGKATFVNLLYGDYLLKEDSAPEGYLVGINDTQRVTIDTVLHEVTVENEKSDINRVSAVGAVQLQKVDEETGESLQGALFALQQKVDDEFVTIAEMETDEEGIVFAGSLEPGDYQFVELNAPVGYKLDETPVVFTIEEDQTETIALQKENHLIPGSVQLVKVDA